MGMSTNTTMRLVTVPTARQIHPIGHTPTSQPAECLPQRPRASFQPSLAASGATQLADSVVLGVRVRNAARFRRRRAVATVLTTALLLATWSLLSVFAHHLVPAAAGDPVPTSAAAVHVVQPGDTLWSIATDVMGAPGDSVRQVVDELAGRTGGASLAVGQHVRLDGIDVG